jgi:rod shape-determining protein MreC
VPALTHYLSRRAELLVLVLLIVLSVTLRVLSSAQKDFIVRAANDAAMTPLQRIVTLGDTLLGLRAENDSLRAALARSEVTLASLQEAVEESERLREMLAFRERSGYDLLAARIVAQEATRAGYEYKIDKGARDGVRRDLAVITTSGLVGKITAVAPHSAFVRPLLAPGCRVSARLVRSRTAGIIEWAGGRSLELTFLPLRAEVTSGDEVVTSGLGGVFPAGLPVGAVVSVETAAVDGSLRVLLAPVVDFTALEEIFVVAPSVDRGVADAGEQPGSAGEREEGP